MNRDGSKNFLRSWIHLSDLNIGVGLNFLQNDFHFVANFLKDERFGQSYIGADSAFFSLIIDHSFTSVSRASFRSQKRKKTLITWLSFFVLLASVIVKTACKNRHLKVFCFFLPNFVFCDVSVTTLSQNANFRMIGNEVSDTFSDNLRQILKNIRVEIG